MNIPVLIRKISQKDNHTFTIEWSDGAVNDYRLSHLQRNCPCAGCNVSDHKPANENAAEKEDVRATRINSVGRYALRIQFSSGCSKGIYSFEMLRDVLHK